MRINVTKRVAAVQQLDVAIELLFADRDPLAVRTLAAAAYGLFADLVEYEKPGTSWREKLIAGSGLSRRQAIEIINGASNFLKHADRDSNESLSFEEEENDYLIFFATLECGELGEPLSPAMQAFQVWYLACYPNQLGTQTESVAKATAALPELPSMDRQKRLQRGAEFASQVVDRLTKGL